jgi:ribose 1,5-bisphosphokinase
VSTRVVYLMGPSGAGKDTLLAYARSHLPEGAPVAFAHRYITRAIGTSGENHVALSEAEFAVRADRGCFALHWRSHGWRYGIGVEIDAWLARGLDVVVSGSREHLPQAAARYPDLRVVLVTAPLEVLRRRIIARGRDSAAGIAARLERAAAWAAPTHPLALEIVNDGPVERAGDALLDFLLRLSGVRSNA